MFALAMPAVYADAGRMVYVEDGKTPARSVELLPATSPIEHYTENLTRISPEMATAPAGTSDSTFTPESLAVTRIATWHDYEVYDVRNDEAGHRSIVLKEKTGNYRILYTQYGMAEVSAENVPILLSVQGHILLGYRAQIPGTGNLWHEYYFINGPTNQWPVRLSLEPIEAELKKILPEDRAVWKGGGFDIATLSYAASVWRKDDGNCCPTGGFVNMKLEIRNSTFAVVESSYDPAWVRKKDS